MRRNYANVTATLALVVAMSGSAIAAGRYLITSTGQIKPSVLRQLRAPNPQQAIAGVQGAPGVGWEGKPGPEGRRGEDGRLRGPTGAQGAPGTPGAGERGPRGRGLEFVGPWRANAAVPDGEDLQGLVTEGGKVYICVHPTLCQGSEGPSHNPITEGSPEWALFAE